VNLNNIKPPRRQTEAVGWRQTDLSDGALADFRRHRLELWICGQVEFVVPQKLERKEDRKLHASLQKRLKFK